MLHNIYASVLEKWTHKHSDCLETSTGKFQVENCQYNLCQTPETIFHNILTFEFYEYIYDLEMRT